MFTEDVFSYAAAKPPTGMERVMRALAEALEPHLGGAPAEAHVVLEAAFRDGLACVVAAASTPEGARALRLLSEE